MNLAPQCSCCLNLVSSMYLLCVNFVHHLLHCRYTVSVQMGHRTCDLPQTSQFVWEIWTCSNRDLNKEKLVLSKTIETKNSALDFVLTARSLSPGLHLVQLLIALDVSTRDSNESMRKFELLQGYIHVNPTPLVVRVLPAGSMSRISISNEPNESARELCLEPNKYSFDPNVHQLTEQQDRNNDVSDHLISTIKMCNISLFG